MKKFFRDVIGEIREPSEDANKVLYVIRRVVRLMLFFVASQLILQFVAIFWTNNVFIDGFNYILGLSYGLGGFWLYGFRYVKDALMLGTYIYMFFAVSKSIRDNKEIKGKFFKAVLITLVLLPLLTRILARHTFSSMIIPTISSICLAVIIGSAFLYFKEMNEGNETDKRTIRIRNISVSCYVSLILSALLFAIYFILSLKGMNEYYQMYFQNAPDIRLADKLLFYSNYVSFFKIIVLLAIVVCTFISRFKYTKGLKKTSNILIVFIAILSLLLVVVTGRFLNSILSIVVFLIATGYQNKYRVFDEVHKRIFAKIKTAVDNYMHIGRE